jgi:hypothetical protein
VLLFSPDCAGWATPLLPGRASWRFPSFIRLTALIQEGTICPQAVCTMWFSSRADDACLLECVTVSLGGIRG